ncbi:hypothetical protein [Oligella urethralis]|uniref:hypothetical protein n=1 Tax=Oligella urethralis TaxID=90245 RepID=UPI002889FE3F|nr:hypothetical protein [Oligella urethralis]
MRKVILFLSVLMCSFPILAKQHPQLEAVITYSEEVQESVQLFVPLMLSDDDAVIGEFTKFMIDLAKRGQEFGTSSLDQPFDWCAMMGNSARDLWQSLAMARRSTADNSFQINSSLETHAEVEKNCLYVIKENANVMPSKAPVCDENGKCLTPTIIDIK